MTYVKEYHNRNKMNLYLATNIYYYYDNIRKDDQLLQTFLIQTQKFAKDIKKQKYLILKI
jgi:hypothetical protein